jgi:hypothetical protein
MRTVTEFRHVLTVLALALALAAFPLGALASHDFADVPDSNPFHADISALAASGVTTGCGGGNYCPSAFVTREQMAAFMNRLGALAAGKTPVVNADKLDGLDSTDFLVHGEGSRLVRDVIDVAVPQGAPLQSIALDDLPNLAALLGPDPDLTTLSTLEVVLLPQASVKEFGDAMFGLSLWLGEPTMPGSSPVWPIRLWRTSTDAEYSRPSPSSNEMLHLIVVSSVTY